MDVNTPTSADVISHIAQCEWIPGAEDVTRHLLDILTMLNARLDATVLERARLQAIVERQGTMLSEQAEALARLQRQVDANRTRISALDGPKP